MVEEEDDEREEMTGVDGVAVVPGVTVDPRRARFPRLERTEEEVDGERNASCRN